MKIEFQGTLPTIQSAIKVDGGENGCDRIQIDCYGLSVNELKELRGRSFKVVFETEN